ncbi:MULTISPECIES: hypothetical protein [unclassified Streptomyces]|uniref:hypothetical protein n=1 Tax=unclassified Streptomyces TaxID=2593676 RepID=UPI002E10EF5B|nr:DUF3466 family protein [Streptomyces sp. NBC_01197]WSS49683.1 DUF3466 family protein [Streptomyces sp. NBC_01180]
MATVTTLVAATVTGISEANGLNATGSVVGQEDTVFAYVWNPTQPNGTTGTPTQLPALPTVGAPGKARARSINANGVICGESEGLDASGNPVTRAVLWTSAGIQDLGTLIPDPGNPGFFVGNSRALHINDNGQIVGASDSATGSEHAFLFDPTTASMTDLGALVLAGASGTTDTSRATSINSQGDVVGVSNSLDTSGTPVERAFLSTAGSGFLADLGTLLPDPANPGSFLGNSSAFGINDNGTIIGTSDGGGGLTGVTRFFSGSPPAPVIPSDSEGSDVGPNDDIVGSIGSPAVGFTENNTSGLVDLTTLAATAGMTVDKGTGVSASGQITASATVGGSSVGILITP